MTPDNKILYTDGHDVTVTDSFLLVKKSLYQLKGITYHGFLIIHPDRLPAFFLVLLGGMMISLGALNMIPASLLPTMQIFSLQINGNLLTLIAGSILLLAGGIVMGLMKDRYALRIATAEGEKNVVVSPKREYISQIVDAMNKAFLSFVTPIQSKSKKMIVSRVSKA